MGGVGSVAVGVKVLVGRGVQVLLAVLVGRGVFVRVGVLVGVPFVTVIEGVRVPAFVVSPTILFVGDLVIVCVGEGLAVIIE